MSDKYQFVCEELEQNERFSHIDQVGAWLRCPYHSGGQEKTASLVVTIYEKGFAPGSFNCFGCHESGGWNKLAKEIGAKGFNITQQSRGTSTFSMQGIGVEAKNRMLPDISKMLKWPSLTAWRGISPEILSKFQVRVSKSRGIICPYIPSFCMEEYVGGIFAHPTGDLSDASAGKWHAKYLNTPGEWTKTSLLGYDQADKELSKGLEKALWVVEGPRDVMNVWQCGSIAVGLLGSYLGSDKINLIAALDPPMVIGATDEDEAGRRTHKQLKEAMREIGIPYRRPDMPPDSDPASLMSTQIKNVERNAFL